MIALLNLMRAKRQAKAANNPPRTLEALCACGLMRNAMRAAMRAGYSGIPIGSKVDLETPIGSKVGS